MHQAMATCYIRGYSFNRSSECNLSTQQLRVSTHEVQSAVQWRILQQRLFIIIQLINLL